jgi:putative transcriptional regulator
MKINIKPLMEQKNMSRYELMKRIGVTYPTITSIYNGESTSIKFEILAAICKELNCTPNDILVDDNYIQGVSYDE